MVRNLSCLAHSYWLWHCAGGLPCLKTSRYVTVCDELYQIDLHLLRVTIAGAKVGYEAKGTNTQCVLLDSSLMISSTGGRKGLNITLWHSSSLVLSFFPLVFLTPCTLLFNKEYKLQSQWTEKHRKQSQQKQKRWEMLTLSHSHPHPFTLSPSLHSFTPHTFTKSLFDKSTSPHDIVAWYHNSLTMESTLSPVLQQLQTQNNLQQRAMQNMRVRLVSYGPS